MNSRFHQSGGFTLIELTVVVAIIIALAAIIVPMVGSAKRDGQAAELLQVIDSLRGACMKYHSDTGTLPIEVSTSATVANHKLSLAQSITGWKGPYLDHSISAGDNPFGGSVEVLDNLSTVPGGFDLLGGGTNTATGPGSCVRFTNVPADIHLLIEAALDQGVAGTNTTTGRVKYTATGGVMTVYLMDLDGA